MRYTMKNEILDARPSWWARRVNAVKRFFNALAVFFAPTLNLETFIEKNSTEKIQARFKKWSARSQFKSLLAAFSHYKAQDFCDAILKHPSSAVIISSVLLGLTPEQKMQLLLQPAFEQNQPMTVLGMLLWQGDKNKLILKKLFEGLSSLQRIHVLSELYNFSHALGESAVTPEVLDLLFEGVTPSDRLLFLATVKHNRSILMHIVSVGHFIPSKNQKAHTNKIKTLEILFKGLTREQIQPLLEHKSELSPESLIWLGYDPSFLKKGGITAIDIATHDHNSRLVHFLNQYIARSHFWDPGVKAVPAPLKLEEAGYKRLR